MQTAIGIQYFFLATMLNPEISVQISLADRFASLDIGDSPKELKAPGLFDVQPT